MMMMDTSGLQHGGDCHLPTQPDGAFSEGIPRNARARAPKSHSGRPAANGDEDESEMSVSETQIVCLQNRVDDNDEQDRLTALQAVENGSHNAPELSADMAENVRNHSLSEVTVVMNEVTDTNSEACRMDTNSCHNASQGETKKGDEDYQPGRKSLVWQTDCDTECSVPLLDTEGSPGQRPCVNVDPLVQTDLLSESVCHSQPDGNKGISDPQNDLEREGSWLEDENEGGKPCLNNHERGPLATVKDTVFSLDPSQHTIQSLYRAADDGNEYSSPSLMVRRRPLSSNGCMTRAGKFWGNRVLSEECLRPLSAVAAIPSRSRRLSLPLDSAGCVSAYNSGSLVWQDKATRAVQSPDACADGNTQDPDKQARKASLVTYRDQEQIKFVDKRKQSAIESERPPLRPVSAKNTKQVRPHQRAQTAGALRAGAGRGFQSGRMISSAPPVMEGARCWELRFTKEELQRALPRKSFFNCHTKTLKDAGYDVEEEDARPRRRRLFFPRHEEIVEETVPAVGPNDPPAIHEPPLNKDTDQDTVEDSATAPTPTTDPVQETAVSTLLTVTERSKRRKASSLQAVVECKPLQQYLSYVNDNPAEYRQMVAKSSTTGAGAALHPSSHPADNCHTARLVSMGRVFQERHCGDRKGADEVLRAVYALNPRAADPNRFSKTGRDKSPMTSALMSRKQPTFPRKEPSTAGEEANKSGQRPKAGNESSQKQESEKAAHQECLLEVDKRRLKAEDWARTVTTEQLLRAKLHVLKELGHEERELSQWWLAFKTCFYIRSKIR